MQFVTDLADLRNSWYNCIVDVRSTPYSQFAPQFNRENLQYFLKHNNMKYYIWVENLAHADKRKIYTAIKAN